MQLFLQKEGGEKAFNTEKTKRIMDEYGITELDIKVLAGNHIEYDPEYDDDADFDDILDYNNKIEETNSTEYFDGEVKKVYIKATCDGCKDLLLIKIDQISPQCPSDWTYSPSYEITKVKEAEIEDYTYTSGKRIDFTIEEKEELFNICVEQKDLKSKFELISRELIEPCDEECTIKSIIKNSITNELVITYFLYNWVLEEITFEYSLSQSDFYACEQKKALIKKLVPIE